VTEDEAIDRVGRGDAATTPEDAAAMRPWERIAALLRELPDIPEMDPGWEDRATARWQARRRRRLVLRISAIALVIVAAAWLLTLL